MSTASDPGAAVRSGAGGARDPDGYIDLRSYAAIGDGRTIALVASDARIDWFPMPDLNSVPGFAALLDARHGGFIALTPQESEGAYQVTRQYVEGTNVLVTTFSTANGSFRVTDCLNTGIAGRLPWAELARRIEGVSGSVRIRATVSPGTCLNTASAWVQDTVHARVLRLDGLTMAVRSLNAIHLDGGDQRVIVDYLTQPGSRHLLALVSTEREPLFLPRPEDIDRGVDRTIENWQSWSRQFSWEGPWAEAVRRSALMLKLLLHSPTGSIAAAATTSLPESLTEAKNWDYRFAWTRDTAYTLNALFRFGLREETHASVSWLLGTIHRHGPQPQVCYRLDGGIPGQPQEHDVPGWRGIGPVVSGNQAADQLQLGVYGDLFTTVRMYVQNGNVLDADTGRMLAGIADAACDRWQSKDAGMWELSDQQHYTTSKLGCWQALSCAVELAEIGQIPGDPARWRSEAKRIRCWVEEHCWDDERGCYTWYPGSAGVDTSILLHAISGFDRGRRMRSTLDVLRDELGCGPYLFRYSGMREEEGAFVACSFWMVSALHHVGREKEARDLMDSLVESGNDVGLYAEMIDPETGEFLGNLPQALSHLALINAAVALSEDRAFA